MNSNRPDHDGELLHCSQDRTVQKRRDDASGAFEVVKILLRGSPADAEREHAMASRAMHLDIAGPLGSGVHAATGRPFVRTRFCDGPSLDRLVADHGAMPAARACAVLLPVAKTLAAMHAMRAADLPHGLCHGDVKPSNLLRTASTTLLLDFEHAGPTRTGACSGTQGYAGPESATATPLAPSFDVYGLGATLCFLLTGTQPSPKRASLDAQHDEVRLLVDACMHASPHARPSAATVAEALEELSSRLEHDELEPARDALLRGDLDACERALHANTEGSEQLRKIARKLRPLLARAHWLEAALVDTRHPDGMGPDELAHRIRRAQAAARRFPRANGVVAAMRDGKREGLARLAASMPGVAELVRKEQFASARARLASLAQLVDAFTSLPSPSCALPGEPATMPSLLSRAPRAFLRLEHDRIDRIEREHSAAMESLRAAEANFALDEANAVIERIGAQFGGASEAVARHRDRLHRLAFYLERVAQSREQAERLFPLAPSEDPRPLRELIAACADAASLAHDGDAGSRAVGIRALAMSLDNLDEEFPSLRNRVAAARDSLARMLAAVTDEAWRNVEDGFETLQKEPVPVRPLQMLLARLDALRTLEALVDRPQRARSSLLDRIETLRLRIEQAQAARDRLARGAEEALARGHWTTGLFDMERAAQHEAADAELADRQEETLRKRLLEARRRKQELEDAQRRSHELQTRYAALEDDPHSSVDDRKATLHELRECLSFLAAHAQKDRGALYARDLRDVDLRLAQEQAQQHEADADRATSAEQALRVAERALKDLHAVRDGFGQDGELPGRLARLLEHWERRKNALDRVVEERQRLQARRSSRRRFAAAAATIAAAAALFAFTDFSTPGEAHAGSHPLSAMAQEQPAALRAAATGLARDLSAIEAAAGSAHDRMLRAESTIGDAVRAKPQLADFAAAAFDHTVRAIRDAAPDGERTAIETEAAAMRARIFGR